MKIRQHACLLPLLAALACPAFASPVPAAPPAAPAYSVTFLPSGFTASDMNNAGQIVGNTQENQAWIWSDEGIVNLSLLTPGVQATAINNRGEAAGYFSYPDASAFIYSQGQIRDIGRPDGLNYAIPHAINDRGEVAGTAGNFPGDSSRAFLYSGGTMTAIGTFGGDQGDAYGLNKQGQVVGATALPAVDAPRGEPRAFLYRDGSLRQLFGPGGEPLGVVYDINDAGTLALSPVGTARGINNDGNIVGNFGRFDSDLTHAFLYADGSTIDLNDLIVPEPGWTVTEAEDINDAGQILGTACFGSTQDCRSIRLDLIPAIPEPRSAAMLLAGLAGLGALRRLRGRSGPGRSGPAASCSSLAVPGGSWRTWCAVPLQAWWAGRLLRAKGTPSA
ncbi:hypothetical protein IM543_12090 [Massilia sp. UMI-21]|nr:hypothetical protein IM543_12090 [Massilia sp. UMI-21]